MKAILFSLVASLATIVPVIGADWPEFLGPGGVARTTESVPLTWGRTENLLWRSDIPGRGASSPIIVGDLVFVTCYVDEAPSSKRQLICLHKVTGEQQWTLDFPVDYREDANRGFITEHGYASNTPVSDGEHIYVFLGKGGVHCVTLQGELKWSTDVGKGSSNRQWGSAASLVLYKDSVIVNASEESTTIFCLEQTTGEERWRQKAGMLELTYATPRIVSRSDGVDELVIGVPEEIWSLNPVTGKLVWYASTPSTGNVSPSLIVDGGIVYGFGGYRASGSIAVKVGGNADGKQKDVTDTNVLWTNRSSSYVATPLLIDGRFYWIDDRGIAYCTSAEDGEVIYRQRVSDLQSGRPVYASPVLIGEHIYAVTRRSGTIVYKPSDAFKPVARNILANDSSDFNASPAVSDGRLYLRSDEAIYCIASRL